MPITNTLQRTVSWASIFVRLSPLTGVGGTALEPALTAADYVRQTILGPPFAWNWNRVQTAFLATIGQQDYLLTSFTSSAPMVVGQILLDSNGNQQSVTVRGATAAGAPAWNTALGGLTVSGGVTFVNQGSVDTTGYLVPFTNFGWLEKAVAIDSNGNPHELTVQLNSGQNTVQNQPFVISPVINDTFSVLFRIQPPPDQDYKIYLTWQKSAPSFTALADTWYPIPDYMSYLYNEGFLSKIYEYLSDERFGSAEQMFVKFLVAANEGLSESQVNIFLAERLNTARQSQNVIGTAQSARAGRSLG